MRKLASHTDESLVSLLKLDKMDAFEEIYYRYWKRIYGTALKRDLPKDVCEELVQDIFTALWANREKNSIEHLSSYLFTALKYKVINCLQREMVRKEHFNQQPISFYDNSTEEHILADNLKSILDKEIDKLPSRCQLVFKLSREQNLSMKQISIKLGISEKTVENQLGKAIKVLKDQLKTI